MLLLLVCAALVLPGVMEAQGPILRKTWKNTFIEGCGGFADLPKALVQVGDPTIVEIPNAVGYTTCMAAGVQLRRWLRFKFEWEKASVEGTGIFIQSSSDPTQSGTAVGKFGINPDSKMFVAEFDLWGKHRFHPFIGGGFGKTKVLSHFIGKSGEYPVVERDKDRIFDGTGRAGIRYRMKDWIELNTGVYGNDSIVIRGGITFFPGRFFSRDHRK